MNVINLTPSLSFSGATLVIPAVSIGNVGQLAMDLIIETTQAPRVARLSHPMLLPCAGTGAFSHIPGTAFSMELYQLPSNQSIYLVQQRGPAAPGLSQPFAQDLAAWAASVGFSQIWVLGSLDGSFRRDEQLQGSQLRFYGDEECYQQLQQALATAEGTAAIPRLEPGSSFLQDKPIEKKVLPPWTLLNAFKDHTEIKCGAILSFALEGYNVPEAAAVATVTATSVLSIGGGAVQWKEPGSWKDAFGSGARPIGF